jgi:hypothetical protein
VPNILTISVPNPDQLLNAGAYGAGAVVQVQSGALEAGPFTDDGTVPIVTETTSYTYYDIDGTSSTWYRTRYENAAGTTVSDWGTPFQPHSSLVQLADAQSRSGASVTQAMIDGVEADLAAMIGPLTGERSETFYLDRLNVRMWDVDGVYLSRRTNSVTIETDGTPLVSETDFRLVNGYVVDLIDTGWYGDQMVATYTPNDTVLVKEAIYDLLTYRTLPSNLQSVRIGAYSETYFPGGSGDPVVAAAISKVLPSAGMGLTSPFRHRSSSLPRTLITET